MNHVVLLGDSILDNGAYVAGGSPVIELLRARLPREWRASILAIDGSMLNNVSRQLHDLPGDATHLIVSAGGNDALEYTPMVNSPNPDSEELLAEFVGAQYLFRNHYQSMLEALAKVQLPVVTCTIYDAVPGLNPIEKMALSLFNDVIVREAARVRVPVLDLRLVCTESVDYAEISPIEPSETGGAKIARALQRILLGHDFSRGETVIYG
ncbi:hypothetical protein Pan153_28690 [Gimesia panareensis]|uniref:SGNH hydrolase-type esterase domain-containing protein n=1 Tax=Gimesia panareensis TaxID=2527978 RepID=A0A518FPD5_9PLAN|nr:SGNH/GDSL hydrolase family protein [Gimesia panareensis]QDV18212.1 hypothetical protein Pan153_28690 [Gimesia panareensis]